MSENIILYKIDVGPVCRTVQIVAHLIGVKLKEITLDFRKGEQFHPWYLKLNPEHTVPTIVDNEKTLYDSHAIACYLIDKYAKIDDLYPRDLYLRAKCNQRLFFDASILFSGFHNCSKYIFQGNCSISKQLIDVLISAYDLLEASFGNDHYLVGNKITVADISTMAIITVIDEIYVAIDPKKYIRITAWLKRMKSLDFYEEMNAKPIVQYKAFLMRKMESNK